MTRTLRSRRLALVASVVVLGLTACGTDGDSVASPSGAGDPVGTVVTDGPAVIRVAGQAGTPAASPTGGVGAMEADAPMSDRMMMAYLQFVYEGAAPDLTGPATAWSFPAGTSADPARIAAIAAALGADGEVRTLPADQGGGFQVGPADYSGDVLTVSSDALHSWWFSPYVEPRMVECPTEADMAGAAEGTGEDSTGADTPAAAPRAGTDAGDPDVAAPPPDEVQVDPVPYCEPTPPVGVPTAAEAEARVRELLAVVGLDPATHELETWADEWGTSVTAWLTLDGVRTTVSASFGFGEQGALTWASGYLATPVRGDEYPRIGVEAAVERLNTQQQSWLGYARSDLPAIEETVDPMPVEPAVEPAVEPDGGDVAAEAPAAPLPDGSDDVLVDPMPVEPAVEPLPVDPMPVDPAELEPIVVTLTGGEPSLEQLWDVDGTVWLVPGYSFDTGDGGWYTVAAIPDEYLQTEPVVVAEPEPAPVDTAVPVDPVPPTEPVPSDPTDTGVPATTAPAPDVPETGVPETGPVVDAPVEASVDDGAAWIGLTLDEAAALAAEAGLTVRAVLIDGVDQAITMDLRLDRLNVAVEAGLVTEILSVG